MTAVMWSSFWINNEQHTEATYTTSWLPCFQSDVLIKKKSILPAIYSFVRVRVPSWKGLMCIKLSMFMPQNFFEVQILLIILVFKRFSMKENANFPSWCSLKQTNSFSFIQEQFWSLYVDAMITNWKFIKIKY